MPSTPDLVLGPLLRHVDETSAVIWAEVAHRAEVEVRGGGRRWSSPTFCVRGRHYALIDVDGLGPGTSTPYELAVDDAVVWPRPAGEHGLELPPSRIRTLSPDRPLRMAYGSCRTSVAHDAAGNASHGVDVLRAYAYALMTDGDQGEGEWPDLVLFLGDQVYADETSDAMQEFIASRRSLEEPPGEELKDYDEYAHLYRLAWEDPANRWLLSTLPSAMIFDDHDVRDDWNTSRAWRDEVRATPWWHERIVGGLASYWVYQHLGNLSPAARAEDEMWQRVLELREQGLDDVTEHLMLFAERADAHPDTCRWSYVRDVARTRLVVIDSRAARVLDPGERRMLDRVEADWLAEQIVGDVDHLFIGTSLPYLLPMGLHEGEAFNEALADGAWGGRAGEVGERIRQGVDLEHWAAFQHSFREIADLVQAVVRGERGAAPATVTFLSGDVHHSYLAEVDTSGTPGSGRIVQAVCSPIRNPLPRFVRVAQSASRSRPLTAVMRFLARRAGVADPPFSWEISQGPWFDNMLATVQVHGRRLRLRWFAADTDDGPDPQLRVVSEVDVRDRTATTPDAGRSVSA